MRDIIKDIEGKVMEWIRDLGDDQICRILGSDDLIALAYEADSDRLSMEGVDKIGKDSVVLWYPPSYLLSWLLSYDIRGRVLRLRKGDVDGVRSLSSCEGLYGLRYVRYQLDLIPRYDKIGVLREILGRGIYGDREYLDLMLLYFVARACRGVPAGGIVRTGHVV